MHEWIAQRPVTVAFHSNGKAARACLPYDVGSWGGWYSRYTTSAVGRQSNEVQASSCRRRSFNNTTTA